MYYVCECSRYPDTLSSYFIVRMCRATIVMGVGPGCLPKLDTTLEYRVFSPGRWSKVSRKSGMEVHSNLLHLVSFIALSHIILLPV